MNSSSRSIAPGSSKQKTTFSKLELEQLVEREVQCAIKQKQNSLDVLIETIQQQLSQGMNYETSIRTLQSQMMELVQRAEKALDETAQKNPTPPHSSNSLVRSHLESEHTCTTSKDTDNLEVSSVTEFMERTKKEFEQLHAENAALKAAFEDIRERTTPSPTSSIRRPNELFEGLAKILRVKKEPTEKPEDSCTVSAKRSNEDETKMNRNPKRIISEPRVPYPTLPKLPFPTMLSFESVYYSFPPRLKVELALIKNPFPQLSVVWHVEEVEPKAPPMDSYSIYNATEVAIGSGLFNEWQKVIELAAMPLPMFYPQIKYSPGYKICVTVVGKDKFGRYGPFSEVACVYF